MRTPLAWHNLLYNKARTATAVAGVGFAVTLVFMQLGFLGSVETTVTRIYDALSFDLLIRSRGYLHLSDPKTFPRDRLVQAASVPGVREVSPLYIELNMWQLDRHRRSILTMGVRPTDPVFTSAEVQRKLELLTDEQFVIIDRKSRHEFGPRNEEQFSEADVGRVAEVGGKRVEIRGLFELGTGLAADGAILVNVAGFCRLLPNRTPDQVSLGLIALEEGSDAKAVAAALSQILPQDPDRPGQPRDVDVLTRAQVVQYELNRWVNETSIGLIFQLGVFVAMLVGTAIVYQVLSSDVASHLAEYATLKAMGYTGRYLSGVVLKQAMMLSILGFLPGLALSEVLYRWTSHWSNIPIMMNPGRIAWVLALTVGMCAISGLGALWKVASADPVDLF